MCYKNKNLYIKLYKNLYTYIIVDVKRFFFQFVTLCIVINVVLLGLRITPEPVGGFNNVLTVINQHKIFIFTGVR